MTHSLTQLQKWSALSKIRPRAPLLLSKQNLPLPSVKGTLFNNKLYKIIINYNK